MKCLEFLESLEPLQLLEFSWSLITFQDHVEFSEIFRISTVSGACVIPEEFVKISQYLKFLEFLEILELSFI